MLPLLRKRRSVRKYLDTAVPVEVINQLAEAVLRAPSSRNLRPWQFIFVQDRKTIDKLSRVKAHGSSFLAGAPLCVVILADPDACDVWIEDCSIAAILLQMQVESLPGMGSCWIQTRLREDASGRSSEDAVREILGVPGNLRVASIIAIGYANEALPLVGESELPTGKIHTERYPG